jgi:hypothetical protein
MYFMCYDSNIMSVTDLTFCANPEISQEYQPILACPSIESIDTSITDLFNGIHAAIIMRRKDREDTSLVEVLVRNHGLRASETQTFDRLPLSIETLRKPSNTEREYVHLDRFDSGDSHDRGSYPYTATVVEITEGQSILVAGLASRSALGYSPTIYASQRKRLNDRREVGDLKVKTPKPGFNRVIEVPHKGVHLNILGAIILQTGDQAIISQGGGKALSPAWHAVMTTPNTRRRSISTHLVCDRRDRSQEEPTLDRRVGSRV